MHNQLAIAHDLRWQKREKPTWGEIKKTSPNFVLLAGSRGTAAVKWDGGSGKWIIITATGEGIKRHNDSSINAAMQYIKDDIGKVMTAWEAIDAGKRERYGASSSNRFGAVDIKRKARADVRKIDGSIMMDPAAGYDTNLLIVTKKLKPLYTRYLEHALADIKGVVGMQIKAGAYEKAQAKLNRLKALQNMVDALEDGKIPEVIGNCIKSAATLTAGHFYPNETGDITKGYSGLEPANSLGLRKLMQDIAGGDTKKLATLMAYFKNTLLNAPRIG
jgi:hypothetical protein